MSTNETTKSEKVHDHHKNDFDPANEPNISPKEHVGRLLPSHHVENTIKDSGGVKTHPKREDPNYIGVYKTNNASG